MPVYRCVKEKIAAKCSKWVTFKLDAGADNVNEN